MEICLPLHYPAELPIVWIRPDTSKTNLVVRVTENVDGNGMVRGMEGLRQLRLVELLSHLQNLFGYQLPIVSAEFARPSNNVSGGETNNTVQASNADHNINYNKNVAHPSHPAPTISTSSREILKKKVVNSIEEQLIEFNDEMEAILKTNSTLTEGQNILNREKLMLNNEINLLI